MVTNIVSLTFLVGLCGVVLYWRRSKAEPSGSQDRETIAFQAAETVDSNTEKKDAEPGSQRGTTRRHTTHIAAIPDWGLPAPHPVNPAEMWHPADLISNDDQGLGEPTT